MSYHYAELTFKSQYGGDCFTRSTLVLNAKTENELEDRIQEALAERVEFLDVSSTELESMKRYEK